MAQQYTIDVEELRREYNAHLLQSTVCISRTSANTIQQIKGNTTCSKSTTLLQDGEPVVGSNCADASAIENLKITQNEASGAITGFVDEYVNIENNLDYLKAIDEQDNASDETVLEGRKCAQSKGGHLDEGSPEQYVDFMNTESDRMVWSANHDAYLETHTAQDVWIVNKDISTVTTTLTPAATSMPTHTITCTATSSEQSIERTPDDDNDDDNDEDCSILILLVHVNPLFYELVDFIFKKTQGQDPMLPALPLGLSPTHNEMYRTALQLLLEPGDVTKKKPALVALSGIVNTLDHRLEPIITDFNHHLNRMRVDDLFLVTGLQCALFRKMLQILGVGEQGNLRCLRRFCSERRSKLEEEEELGWPESGAEEKREELRVTH
ncbi:hypothetical protein BGX27_001642, partial [Mortierella sp. AM989]